MVSCLRFLFLDLTLYHLGYKYCFTLYQKDEKLQAEWADSNQQKFFELSGIMLNVTITT